MNQNTCNIIRACKSGLYSEIDNRVERVKAYMSDECYCPKEAYTEGVMNSIVINTMYDYIDTCDKPSEFLRLMVDSHIRYKTCAEQICNAFSLVAIKDNQGYVNGFKEEFFE